MSWGEAVRLMAILRRDSSSQFAASIEQWDGPVSAEWAMLANLFDVQHMSKAKKRPDPVPRPWDKGKKTRTRRGDAGGRSLIEVAAILNAHGHSLPV